MIFEYSLVPSVKWIASWGFLIIVVLLRWLKLFTICVSWHYYVISINFRHFPLELEVLHLFWPQWPPWVTLSHQSFSGLLYNYIPLTSILVAQNCLIVLSDKAVFCTNIFSLRETFAMIFMTNIFIAPTHKTVVIRSVNIQGVPKKCSLPKHDEYFFKLYRNLLIVVTWWKTGIICVLSPSFRLKCWNAQFLKRSKEVRPKFSLVSVSHN